MAGLGLILAFSLINYAANSFAYYYRHVKNLNGLRISIKISKTGTLPNLYPKILRVAVKLRMLLLALFTQVQAGNFLVMMRMQSFL